MAEHSENAAQATYWNEIGGPHWVQQQRQFDHMLEGFGRRALESLQARPGERVIDIGCGTATTTLAIADGVGPDGHVLGCDIAQPMIDAARRRGDGIAGLEFAVLDAQSDDLSPDGQPHDAAFSRFGVMFFSDPVSAFANLARHVRRDGGRLTFVCWQHEDRNEWISVPAGIMQTFTPDPVLPTPNAPGPFAFQDPNRVHDILIGGGWADPLIVPWADRVIMGGGDGLDAALAQTMGTTVAQNLRGQVDDATFAAATAEVRSALADHLVDGAVTFDGNAWLVTADRW